MVVFEFSFVPTAQRRIDRSIRQHASRRVALTDMSCTRYQTIRADAESIKGCSDGEGEQGKTARRRCEKECKI